MTREAVKVLCNASVGLCVYANNDKYEGEWRDDQKCGKGIMTYSNKEKYEGQWENDMKNGPGNLCFIR